MKRNIVIFFSLVLNLFLITSSDSFDNKANRDNTGNWLPYTQDNINQGLFKGGHDTYALSRLDSDRDGMPDEWETAHGFDPNNSADANLDPDNDGLTNLQEYQYGTDPGNRDTDGDGMPDGWEIIYGLNPNVNDASFDKDNDGFSNLREYQNGSNPTDPASIPNQPPVANAGQDQNVITKRLVTSNGSESYDPEGAMITFLWSFLEVPAGSHVTNASLSDIMSAKPQFSPDIDGTYRLQLIVNDGVLNSVPAEVKIIASTPNVAPNANAGPDQNVLTGEIVHLNGSGSKDPDNGPQPLSYLWSFKTIPLGSSLTDNSITDRDKVLSSFTPDISGSYTIKLIVSDGNLASEDTVDVIATTPNVPPNANAGADITIYLSNKAVLDGSASNDPDNGPQPLTYSWSFVSVPTGSQLGNNSISGANTASPSFAPDIAGTYVLQLMVSDGLDNAYDNVAVNVVANATICSYLGNNPNPLLPDVDIFKFNGKKGETVKIRIEANPTQAGTGKRIALILTDKIKGTVLVKFDPSVFPNEIKATLPANGDYLISVSETLLTTKSQRYKGVYCLTLQASPATNLTFVPYLYVE